MTEGTTHAVKATSDIEHAEKAITGIWWALRFGLLKPDAAPNDLRTQLVMSIIKEATKCT